MSPRRTVVVTIAALAVISLTGVAHSQKRRARTVDPRPEGAIHRETAQLTSGAIPIAEFLRYLSLATGKTVVQPSAFDDPMFRPDVMIHMVADVKPLTPEIAQSILEANGYALVDEVLGDGTALTHVRHMSSRQAPPAPRPTVIVGPDEEIPAGSANELIVGFIALEHADSNVVIQALRELLVIHGSRSATGDLQILSIPQGRLLAVQGTRSTVSHVRSLAKHMDVENQFPPRRPVAPKKD